MKTTIVAMSVLALVAAAPAEVGDLEYVNPSGMVADDGGGSLAAGPRDFAKPRDGSGCVHDQAVVAAIEVSVGTFGARTFLVGVDARKADAKAPDVVRFDLTGEGKFDDKAVADLRVDRDADGLFRASFGPAPLTVTRDGRPIKVEVFGTYAKQGTYRMLQLNVLCALGGTCAIGAKTYPVRFVDADGNLSVIDQCKPMRSGGRVFLPRTSDTVLIDTGDGTFKKDARQFSYGQPVFLDGKLWTLTVSDDLKKVSAKPTEGEVGHVRLPSPRASCTLVGDETVLKVSGDKPVAVPVGKYLMMACTESAAPVGKGGEAATLMVNAWAVEDKPDKRIEVPAGKTVELRVGSPLTARAGVPATVRPGKVNLSLVLTDRGGNDVSYVTVAGGGLPPKPRVDILNDKGEKVYSATLEYG